MKYKAGDKVRVKSEAELRACSDVVEAMCYMAEKVVTIRSVEQQDTYSIQEYAGRWTDEMFEGLVASSEKVTNFNDIVLYKIDGIKELFKQKQVQYSNSDSTLANFKRGAQLRYGEEGLDKMYECAKDYVGKHIAHIYAHDIDGNKVDESLLDIAVYSLIMATMVDLKKSEGEHEVTN